MTSDLRAQRWEFQSLLRENAKNIRSPSKREPQPHETRKFQTPSAHKTPKVLPQKKNPLKPLNRKPSPANPCCVRLCGGAPAPATTKARAATSEAILRDQLEACALGVGFLVWCLGLYGDNGKEQL